MSEQPRNAAAGQRQKQYIKENNKEAGKLFSEYGLTRKNEEFMYQLNKQLDLEQPNLELIDLSYLVKL